MQIYFFLSVRRTTVMPRPTIAASITRTSATAGKLSPVCGMVVAARAAAGAAVGAGAGVAVGAAVAVGAGVAVFSGVVSSVLGAAVGAGVTTGVGVGVGVVSGFGLGSTGSGVVFSVTVRVP